MRIGKAASVTAQTPMVLSPKDDHRGESDAARDDTVGTSQQYAAMPTLFNKSLTCSGNSINRDSTEHDYQ